jgi:hypothetical protein
VPATTARSSISKSIRSAAAALLGLAAPLAAAHGFGQRFDLPLPLWLWLAGAGTSIVLTFVLLAVLGREPRQDVPAKASAPTIPMWLASPLRMLAVLIFVVALSAGFFGNQDPYRNLLPTVVWVLWWVGFAFACAFLGNLWALLSPLDSLFRWSGLRSLGLAYPRWLGAWPAVVLLLCFAWAELVWADKDVPARLACAVVGYALITWTGMFLYGRETWLAGGEAFHLAFGVLARFSGAGVAREPPVSFSFMVFVLLMLASVTYDGFLETPLMQDITTAAHAAPPIAAALFALSELGLGESQLIDSAMLLFFPLLFLAAYWLVSRLMVRLAGSTLCASGAGRAFVLTLVPIAVAYHLSHYFSLLLTAGQFIIPLASDPFGAGWDLFGTARYQVDLGIVSPYVFWYGAVVLIIVGHVIAVVLAHALAVRLFAQRAVASQLPLMALMVAYTMLSLWILAQPVVG